MIDPSSSEEDSDDDPREGGPVPHAGNPPKVRGHLHNETQGGSLDVPSIKVC